MSREVKGSGRKMARLVMVVMGVMGVAGQNRQDYNRYLLDSPYNLCRDPLVRRSNVSSTSEMNGRTAAQALLWSGSSWTAKDTDFNQYLTIDMGKVMNVTGISTQGREHSTEYVYEYRIQYGTNGKDFIDYKEIDGSPKLFNGNNDGLNIARNHFNQPIIAQWIRINPTRWADMISMRVELYGCPYISDTLYFEGTQTSYIERDLHRYPISSRRDLIRFRFKTNQENGVLLYSRGSQEDYIALQLVENRLLLNINLGSRKIGKDKETSLTLGSLLDDNVFHEVFIERDRRSLNLSVDRVMIRDRIEGEFHKLDLDRVLYIGGVPNIEKGLVIYDNFKGCIENLYLNHTNVIAAFNNPIGNFYDDENYKYETKGGVTANCQRDYQTIPVTFRTRDAFVKQIGFEGTYALNVSMEFRTFEQDGLLFFHKFSSEGHVKLYLERGRILVQLVANDVPAVTLNNFDQTYSDGNWHNVIFSMSKNNAILTMDRDPMITTRLMEIRTGPYYMIGGGIYGDPGFIGCMRKISIDGTYKLPTDWRAGEEISDVNDIIIDSCQMTDLCMPNPCEHGGICKQTSKDFECECENTGYTGAVCHTSLNYLSCTHFQNKALQRGEDSRYAETVIDIDGSGPIAPFPVTCEFFPDGRNITYVGHSNMEQTKVDGFEEKGSFNQMIYYDASMDMMERLINRSTICLQKLGYDCKRSRLLDTPVADTQKFNPYGWWTSRQNLKMDYWAGSLPGSRKCECGLLGVCHDPGKWCNCDSGHNDWLWDGGEIMEKEYLPVRAVHFGDTGTPMDDGKEGRFTLGPLECNGDNLFENIVTFRKSDAVIELPTFEFGLTSGDIFFEFKTTSGNFDASGNRPMVLLHSTGDTGDFIKVSLLSGDQIQFEFEAGKGQQGLTVETAYRMDDDKWHSVLVEKNRKEAMIVVDGGSKGRAAEPIGPVRPMRLTSSLFVGATKDFSDGYVGCIRALVLNGVEVDLMKEVTRDPRGLYGVGTGCQGKCSSNPCQNGGKCLEGYDSFHCDCRWTPFKGPICADEIGINMRTNYMIKYDFKDYQKSTLSERIHVGFTTTDPKGFLLGAYSANTQEYLTLMISNSGHIRLVFDFGFERQEVVFTEQNFMTGQFHDVTVERFDQGRKLKMTIDNYEPQIYDFSVSLKSGADAQFNDIRYLYIGKNESMTEGFVGCISRVEFDEIIPLKLYFQEDHNSNKAYNIHAEPKTITEDFCGIEPITLPPEEEETRRPPDIDSEAIKELYATTNSIVLGIILGAIFILLVVVCVAIGKYMNRHKGDYYTKEDEGADGAFDADTAVLQGRTGHQVEKKKEWFI